MEEQLRETLADYNGVVIFVTHGMEEAFRFCSELLVLDDGSVIASGPKHQLFERPGTVAAARLTGCKNIVAARRINEHRVIVDDWNCELATAAPVPAAMTHLGIRSHRIALQADRKGENVFPCWLAATSEAPFEMTIYLHLHRAPLPADAPHLQADVSKETWKALNATPQPWYIRLDAAQLLLLEG
jgi:molybdate transport system permease protein